MKLSEFLTVYSFAFLSFRRSNSTPTIDELRENYSKYFFIIPKIYCNDGFKVSIQVHNGAYCSSENGYREFGLDWREVEWGYPSEPLTDEKYNPEDEAGTSVGGYVPIEIMEELIEQHGGIDLKTTLEKYLKLLYYME